MPTYRRPLLGLLLLLAGLTVPVQAQKRTLLQEDISYVNALVYGVTLNDVTLSAAINAQGSDKRVIFLATGTWTMNQSVTVPANITLYIPAGTTVQVNAGAVLSLATIPHYDQPYWFTGAGSLRVTDSTWPIDVRVYGAVGDGSTDNVTAINAALAAAQATGSPILFPCGTYNFNTTITVLNGTGIKLTGPTTSRSTSGLQCAILQYTSATGHAFWFDGTVGVELAYLTLTYSSASYADHYLLLQRIAGSQATESVYLHDLTIQGTAASSQNAASGVTMELAADITIERCLFAYLAVGITGATTVATAVQAVRIRDNTFHQSLLSYAILGGGLNWTVEANRFRASGAGHAFAVRPAGMIALTYANNFHDATNNSGTIWFAATAGALFGGVIQGNFITDTNASSNCIRVDSPAGVFGVTITGNYLNCGAAVAGSIAFADSLITANYNASPIPHGSAAYPVGNSFVQYPSISSGSPAGGTALLRVGVVGGAGTAQGKVLCYDNTTNIGRLYVSSNGTDCSN